MKRTFTFIIIFLIIISCGQKKENLKDMQLASVEYEMAPLSENRKIPKDKFKKEKVVQDKKIIKDGDISIQVTKLKESKKKIDNLLKKYNSYYSKENLDNNDYEQRFNLTIRIPNHNFDNFIEDVESGDGNILNKNIAARDVTDKFIDLTTRLNNKRSYLKRYKDLLKRANSIEEILKIEEKIRRLEEEIDSTEGRLRYLNNQVDFSTLNLTLIKKLDYKFTPDKGNNFWERFKRSVSHGWTGLISFFLFLVLLWPYWIILAVIIYFWRRHKRRKRSNSL